jgi:hypothetical protein
MATIAISCPKCEKQIKLPAELEGKKIKCKECLHIFTVKAPPGAAKAGAKPADKGAKAGKAADKKDKAAAAPAADDDDEGDGKSYGVTEESFLPRCAYCAKEMESEEQVVCLHCGYNHRTRERHLPKKTYDTSGGQQFVWLLPGILCVVGDLILIGCIVVFWAVFPGLESDHKDDWWSIFFGLWARIWGTVILLFVGFWLTKFAVKRLILNPHAPEREKLK